MEDSVDPMHDVLAEVAAVQREQVRRADVLGEVRARLLARPARRASRLWLAAPALAACGAAAFALTLGREPALTFRTGAATPGTPGQVMTAERAELPLDFSDGSRVALTPGARLVVEATAARGATLALERGRADVRVVHREKTSWVVKAGPARVAVTGTRFWVAWDPAGEELTVEMREGSVVVSDAPGASGSASLRAGQTLRASGRRGRFEIVDALGEPAPEAPPTVTERPPAEAPAARPAATARALHPAARVAEPEWRALAASARYADALRAAERAGFTSSCDTLGADDLVQLGDVARLAGEPARAEQAYRAARRRFPAVDRSVFALGLMAFEQRHRYAEAADWFETYLGQYPSGALTREASGRLLEARHRAGDHARATRAARDYLGRYPAGPHAALARQILAP